MAGELIRSDVRRSASVSALKPKLPPILPFGRNRGRVERLDEKQGFEWVGEALTRTQEALETLWEAAGEVIRSDVRRSAAVSALKPKLPPILPFGRNRGRVERLDEKQGFEWVGEALTRTQILAFH